MDFAPRLPTTCHEGAIAAAIQEFGLTRALFCRVERQLLKQQFQVVLHEFELRPVPVYLIHGGARDACRKTRAFVDLAASRLSVHRTIDPMMSAVRTAIGTACPGDWYQGR